MGAAPSVKQKQAIQILEAVALFLDGCGLSGTVKTLREEASAVASAEKGEGEAVLQAASTLAKSLGPLLSGFDATRNLDENEDWIDVVLEQLTVLSNLIRAEEGDEKPASTPEPDPADPSAAPTVQVGTQQPALPPMPTDPPPQPSGHYNPTQPGEPLQDGMADEYRDDGDPGYRILQVAEVELVLELQEKYQSLMSAPAEEDSPLGQLPAASATAKVESEASLQVGSKSSLLSAEELGVPAEAAPQVALAAPLPRALANERKARHGANGQPAYRYPPSNDEFYPAEFDGIWFDSYPLRIVYERDRTGFEPSKEFPIEVNTVIAARYQVLNYLGSAAFSRAVQCFDLLTGEMVCMKIIKNEKDFVDQSLDEIKLLKLINANADDVDEKHCLRLIDYFYHKEHLIIITELLRDNLYEYSKWIRERGEAPYFTLGRLQRITLQLLRALEYIHGLWLIHADLKPENVLVKSYSRCLVKLIDFGSSCFVDDRLSAYVQSRSYRAPEVLLGLKYGQKIDIWSLGCVIAELWTGFVLFLNDSVQSLLARIIGIIGPIPRPMLERGKLVPQYFTQDGRLFREVAASPEDGPPEYQRRIQLLLPKKSSLRQRMRTDDELFVQFLTDLLKIDPDDRPTATMALQHPWLQPGRYPDGL